MIAVTCPAGQVTAILVPRLLRRGHPVRVLCHSSRYLDRLTALETVLREDASAASQDRSAAELATAVEELKQARNELKQAVARHESAVEQAQTSPQSAVTEETAAADGATDIRDRRNLPAAVESRPGTARRTLNHTAAPVSARNSPARLRRGRRVPAAAGKGTALGHRPDRGPSGAARRPARRW